MKLDDSGRGSLGFFALMALSSLAILVTVVGNAFLYGGKVSIRKL